jgi:hypothetical protein
MIRQSDVFRGFRSSRFARFARGLLEFAMSDRYDFSGDDGRTRLLSDTMKADFWGAVKRILREVFAADEKRVDRLRTAMDGAPSEIQRTFYDLEPFAVAVDLSKELHRRH